MPDTHSGIRRSVSLQFGETWALRELSLELEPRRDTHVFWRTAGSGKTSLLKAVIGLIPVDAGVIHLFGHDITRLREARHVSALRAAAGFLFQEGGLFDSLTVGENVEYPLLNQQAASAGQ